MGKDFVVTVSNPDRMNDWIDIFDAVQVHVISPFPEVGELPDYDEPQLVYKLDLEFITSHQREKMVKFLANRFGLEVEQVEAGIEEHGVPILAQDCMISIHNPQKWLGE